MAIKVEQICVARGIKMTEQRKLILSVIEKGHPDVEELYQRANKLDSRISLATVYRTINTLVEHDILTKLEFGEGRARYEILCDSKDHHHHLIDVESGKIIEFFDEELEVIKEKIAHRLGYKLVDHKLELYGIKIEKELK